MPSYESFLKILIDEYDCIPRHIDKDPFPISYIERTIDGKKYICPVNIKDTDILTPTLLGNICRRLKIDDHDRFGFSLGFLPTYLM